MTYFLTSSPSVSVDGALNPANGFVETLRRNVRISSNCLFITSNPDNAAYSDNCAISMRDALQQAGFMFRSFTLVDRRNAADIKKLMRAADFIILGGGHVPTQNAFLKDLNLAELIKDFRGVVLGISAGSMNCANTVYAIPEEKGEAESEDFVRFLTGLGMTDVKILPHYDLCRDMKVDGKRVYEDIAMEDSKKGHRFYVFPDGTYLMGRSGFERIYGKFFIIENGVMRRVSDNGQCVDLPII